MAIAFDAASSGTTAFDVTITFSHTCTGSDRALFVMVATPSTVSGVTYNGDALTAISGGGTQVALYGLLAPDTGENNIVVTVAGDEVIVAAAASYTGVDQTTGWENLSASTTGDASPSVSVTSATGDRVVGGSAFVDNAGAKSHTPGSGVTERADEDGASLNSCAAIGDADGASSVTFAMTRVGGAFYYNQRIAAVSVIEASGGGGSISFDEDYQISLPVISGW